MVKNLSFEQIKPLLPQTALELLDIVGVKGFENLVNYVRKLDSVGLSFHFPKVRKEKGNYKKLLELLGKEKADYACWRLEKKNVYIPSLAIIEQKRRAREITQEYDQLIHQHGHLKLLRYLCKKHQLSERHLLSILNNPI